MSYREGEKIEVFFQNGATLRATILRCEKGYRGWLLRCLPIPVGLPEMEVWDSQGCVRPRSDQVVGVRRAGLIDQQRRLADESGSRSRDTTM